MIGIVHKSTDCCYQSNCVFRFFLFFISYISTLSPNLGNYRWGSLIHSTLTSPLFNIVVIIILNVVIIALEKLVPVEFCNILKGLVSKISICTPNFIIVPNSSRILHYSLRTVLKGLYLHSKLHNLTRSVTEHQKRQNNMNS